MWNEAVLFDDFRADVCELHWLLQLLDRYPIDVPVKGGFVAFRPKRIYITSAFPPEGVYRNVCEENMQQLRRRIDRVINCVSVTAPTCPFSLSRDAVSVCSPDGVLGSVEVSQTCTERSPLPSGIPFPPESAVEVE